jgi:hypothetical protein
MEHASTRARTYGAQRQIASPGFPSSTFYLAPLLLILLSSLPVASAQSCRNTTCNNNGECINPNTTSLGCSCDLNGDRYGLYCNQTSLECALDRCSGRGTCLIHVQECICGLTRYNGQTGCSTCISGYDLSTNCTNCSSGWFGPTCSLSAVECGLTRCNARGRCTDDGGCSCFGTLFSNLTNCLTHPCGDGFPSIESDFTQCACSPGFVPDPLCQRDCGPHGVSPDNVVCSCLDQYGGTDCDIPPLVCAHGTLLNYSYCECDPLYTGLLCDSPLANCTIHGTPISATQCECSDGWAGDLCDIPPLAPHGSMTDWAMVVVASMASLLLFVSVLAYAMRYSPPEPPVITVNPEETKPLVKRRKPTKSQ